MHSDEDGHSVQSSSPHIGTLATHVLGATRPIRLTDMHLMCSPRWTESQATHFTFIERVFGRRLAYLLAGLNASREQFQRFA